MYVTRVIVTSLYCDFLYPEGIIMILYLNMQKSVHIIFILKLKINSKYTLQ